MRPASTPACPPAPDAATPCRAGDRPARQVPPPRNADGNAGTAAPSIPKARLPPSPTAPCAPSGSKHPETSASCGPVAISSGSSSASPYGGIKTGQLVCYITRTTHLLTTLSPPLLAAPGERLYSLPRFARPSSSGL